MSFVPPDFVVPDGLETDLFRLEPLGPQHNEADYEAWSSSTDHIRASRGWEGRAWPRAMTLDENRRDLERHAEDFAARTGFTYTVLDAVTGETVGCVYIYPDDVRSWVRASRAELDEPLRETVREWLGAEWPFGEVIQRERS